MTPRLGNSVNKPQPLKVFFLCSGLGHVSRGFESFTRECFDALAHSDGLDVTLFKGGGASSSREHTLWNLPRNESLTQRLERWTGRGAYYLEQLTFAVSLLPYLFAKTPDVIFFSDMALGNALWHLRRKSKLSYRFIFSNGGPFLPPFPRWDLVQQVSPEFFEEARLSGVPDSRQMLVPYGIAIPYGWRPPTAAERDELRVNLGLPVGRPIVITVGAISSEHKRMDYALRELASIPSEKRPFLVMLGAQDSLLSPPVHALAAELLPAGDYTIRSVPYAEVAHYLRASNIFTLCSLREGFGRVYLEALLSGLPVIAHDFETSRYVLGSSATFIDMTNAGALAASVVERLSDASSGATAAFEARHRDVATRFGWHNLVPLYTQMLQRAASQPLSDSYSA